MVKRYLARNTLIAGVLELAESFGIRREEILDEVGLDPAMAQGVGGLIPSEAIIDAVEFAAIRSGRGDFGLLLGARQDHRVLGPLGLLLEQASTIGELQSFSDRFFHLHNPALRYTLTRKRQRGLMQLQIRAKGTFEPRHYVECLFVICIRMAQIILGPKWRPLSVSLKHEQLASRSAYERYFGAHTRFKQDLNGLVCSGRDFEVRVAPRSPELKQKLEVMLQDLDTTYSTDIAAKVSHLIRALLPAGHASIEHVAKLLLMTPRTLQRKLQARGVTFAGVLARTRLEMARDYLRRDGVSITQVAPILGFSEASAVSRFLRDQVGLNARDFRKRARRRPGAIPLRL